MLLGNATFRRGSAGSDNRCVNAVLAAYLNLIGAPLATAYPDAREDAGDGIDSPRPPGPTGTRRAIALARRQ